MRTLFRIGPWMAKHVLTATLVVHIALNAAHGCSIVSSGSEEVSPEEYVLYGEVVGYSRVRFGGCAEDSQSKSCSETWGWQLKVVESLQMPKPVSEVGLFFLGIDSLCNREPYAEDLVRKIPLGAKFKISAQPLGIRIFDNKTVALDGNLPGALVVPVDRTQNLRALARSSTNYSGLWPTFSGNLQFELRKAVLRLGRSGSERESFEILLSLGGCRVQEVRCISSLDDLIDRHLHDPQHKAAVRRRIAAYDSMVTDDDPESPGEIHLTLSGPPHIRVLRALRLIEHGFELESLSWLESAVRETYLPAQLCFARVTASLAAKLQDLDPVAAKSYAAKSRAAFEETLRRARAGVREENATAMLILASMYKQGEGGLPRDEKESNRLECLGMKHPPADRLPELGKDTLSEIQECARLEGEESEG